MAGIVVVPDVCAQAPLRMIQRHGVSVAVRV